jgi:hypothetical protein
MQCFPPRCVSVGENQSLGGGQCVRKEGRFGTRRWQVSVDWHFKTPWPRWEAQATRPRCRGPRDKSLRAQSQRIFKVRARGTTCRAGTCSWRVDPAPPRTGCCAASCDCTSCHNPRASRKTRPSPLGSGGKAIGGQEKQTGRFSSRTPRARTW